MRSHAELSSAAGRPGLARSGARPAIGAGACRAHGVALVVAMLMLMVIGLVSVAVLRNAIGSDHIAAGNRLQLQASQFAQLALRYCENQLTVEPSSRTVVPVAGSPSAPAWAAAADWTGGGPDLARTLAAADFSGTGPPRVPPQCLVESTGAPGRFVVTARGFSPDFAVDASGVAVAGAVVWLQSMVLVAPAGPGAGAGTGVGNPTPGSGPATPCLTGCAQAIVRRSWQQLLTPPF